MDKNIKNKRWRLNHLYKIQDKKRGLVKFKFNPIQEMLFNQFISRTKSNQPLKEFCLKYRQGGVSTFCELWHFDDTIFHRNTSTGILADKRESLNHLWDIIRKAHAHLPSEIQPKLGDDSKSTLSFPNLGSKIFVSLRIKSTGIHNLHISEHCYCDDVVISETLGATSPFTNITSESTPDNIGGDGYITYQDAKSQTNGYNAIFLPWWLQSEYRIRTNNVVIHRTKEEKKLPHLDDEQIMFRRIMIQKMKQDFWKYYPEDDETCWLLAGSKYFNQKKILKLLTETKEYDKENECYESGDDYIVWYPPNKHHTYVAGADVAEGIDGDYSVLKILDVTDQKEVFRFRGHVGVDQFYKICDKWCRYFRNALLAVERNNHGHAVLMGLYETCQYPNLYEEKKGTRLSAIKEHKYGWQTDKISRPRMLDHLKISIEGDSTEDEHNFEPEFMIRDQELLKEALTFQENDGKFEAATGYHDDCIFATAIAYQMFQKTVRGKIAKPAETILLGNKRQATI